MLFAGGGAQGRDGIAQALLGEGDDVHVALDDDDFVEVAVVLARFVQAVEFLAFMEDRGFRRVEVLGLVVAQHPATKRDDAPATVADREHHAITKAVVALAGFSVFDQQAGIDHGFLLQGVAAQVLEQVVPARWRKTEAEVPGDFTGQPATFEVVHGGFARRMAFQGLAIEIGGGRKQRVQRRIGGLARLVRAPAFFPGDFHPGGLGQFFDSLGEVQVVVVHDEAEGIAASAAAEAVVELLVGADAERRRFLFMERAAGRVVLARFLHLQARADHVDDVGAVQEVVNKALGNQPGHGVLIITARNMDPKSAGVTGSGFEAR
ncbi:hypothetical protein D3C76_1016710 [compost metagenome]